MQSKVLGAARRQELGLAFERMFALFAERGYPASPTGMLRISVTVSPYIPDFESDDE